ncbi:22866_t:CDS:2 [Gigaspora margarita]|uniref:22866_t:CDS:1 n=1 Tax=Gigaspora margarita TaxID=4874 RepID=A0ABM8VWR9_GIGMA|nr:22866_t:CDS:2 [Gigaspora margarita]
MTIIIVKENIAKVKQILDQEHCSYEVYYQEKIEAASVEDCDKIKEFSKSWRPVLVISKSIQNDYDEIIVVVPLTTKGIEDIKPFEIFINNTSETGLEQPSKMIVNHPYAIFKELRLVKYLGKVNQETMDKAKKV